MFNFFRRIFAPKPILAWACWLDGTFEPITSPERLALLEWRARPSGWYDVHIIRNTPANAAYVATRPQRQRSCF